MKILLIAPYYDKNTAGESWSTFKWVEGISQTHEVTVLTTHRSGWNPENSPTQAKEVVNWDDPPLPKSLARLNRELKPTYFLFYLRARKWIKKALKSGQRFDLAHQINPLALRYPCPAQGLGIKYLMGPLAGSLQTPQAFKNESSDKQWFRKLRNLDSFRIKRDPWLRKSYAGAEIILGVAPYVADILKPANIKRFTISSETGVEKIEFLTRQIPETEHPLKLLFVGRIIRTKGVIDAIRAVAIAKNHCKITFDILGEGDMLEACKEEAKRLNLLDIVTFHGRVSREEVNVWYEKSDVFLFPSFREPSGNVVFEAMSFGLPIITSTTGGPGYVVDETCGIKIEPSTIESYINNIAKAIIKLNSNRNEIPKLSNASQTRIKDISLWSKKIEFINNLYKTVT